MTKSKLWLLEPIADENYKADIVDLKEVDCLYETETESLANHEREDVEMEYINYSHLAFD